MPANKNKTKTAIAEHSLDESAHSPELIQHRKKIDALDQQIIALLKERSEIVRNVGEHKRKTGNTGCFIRPGREADMLRRIWDEFADESFSSIAAAQMWRLIIGASTRMESDLRISVCASDEDSSLFWLAREYFGSFVSVQRHPNIKRVIGDIMDSKAEVGILPALEHPEHGDWWLTLAEQQENPPYLFAHVPFITSKNERQRRSSFAIARIKPEPTSDDVTLIVANAGDISIHRLTSAFEKVGMKAAERIRFTEPQPGGTTAHLLRVEEFVAPDDPRLAELAENLSDAVYSWKVLGSYAVPILTDEAC